MLLLISTIVYRQHLQKKMHFLDFKITLVFVYRVTSNNSHGNYQFSTFFPMGIIGGQELLEGGSY